MNATKQMYVLECRLAPVLSGPQAKFSGAFAAVLVYAAGPDRVEDCAREYLLKHGWLIEEQQAAVTIAAGDSRGDSVNQQLFLQAQQFGVAARISGFLRPQK
jgi:hypothetical protein